VCVCVLLYLDPYIKPCIGTLFVFVFIIVNAHALCILDEFAHKLHKTKEKLWLAALYFSQSSCLSGLTLVRINGYIFVVKIALQVKSILFFTQFSLHIVSHSTSLFLKGTFKSLQITNYKTTTFSHNCFISQLPLRQTFELILKLISQLPCLLQDRNRHL